MKSLICCTLLVVSLCSVQGRSYGYHKKTKHTSVVKPKDGFLKDPVHIPNDHGFVKDPVHIPNDHVVLPSNKLPQCNTQCTLQIIPPQCIQETFGFEHGVRCRGCDIDICNSGRVDNLDRWQGSSQWQDGGFQNRNQGIGGGFVDSLGNDFLNVLGQNLNLDDRIRNRFDTNIDRRNRFDTNIDRRNRFDTNIDRRTNLDRNTRFEQIFNERRNRIETNRQVGNEWL